MIRAGQSSTARVFSSPWTRGVSACVHWLLVMRDLFLVVALVLCLLVELVWPQVTSVKATTHGPYDLILDASGGNLAHESPSSPISGFFPIRNSTNDVLAGGSLLTTPTESATHVGTSAFSIFSETPRTDGEQTGGPLGGQRSAPSASNHRDRPDRPADSATSMIHH